MRNVTAKLDEIADRLEKAGMLKEAFRVDVISNTIEAQSPIEQTEVAAPGFMPSQKQFEIKPQSQPVRRETDIAGPKAGDIIKNNRDSFDTQMNVVDSALKAVSNLIGVMSSEASKSYPMRSKNIAEESEKSKQRLENVSQKVSDSIKQELRNFLIVAGGKEEAERFSIDHLRLATKALDKST